MATFLRASASGDALNGAAALLLVGLVLSLAFSSARPTTTAVARLVGAVVLVAGSKPVYCVLPLLVFLTPRSRMEPRRRYWMLVCVILVVAALGFILSSWIAITRYTQFRDGVRAADQLLFIVRHPAQFVGITYRTFAHGFHVYVAHFIGTLGWLDTPLPASVVYGYAALLVGLTLVDGSDGARISLVQRAVLGLVAVSMILGVAVSQWVVWTPTGSTLIEGMQGRYFIPVAPVLVLLLHNRPLSCDITRSRLGWVVFAGLSLASMIAVKTLISRYYV
jgi:uncharacterized membrane protein